MTTVCSVRAHWVEFLEGQATFVGAMSKGNVLQLHANAQLDPIHVTDVILMSFVACQPLIG